MGDENIMDKISIIVPVYNAQKYLKKCINSTINQTYKNIKILLINDGSKDNSFTPNVGIKKSMGDYIVFINSNDWFELDAIETKYNII